MQKDILKNYPFQSDTFVMSTEQLNTYCTISLSAVGKRLLRATITETSTL